MTASRYLALLAVLTWLSPAIVGAADHVILGKTIDIRVGSAGRTVVVIGRETATDVPAISNFLVSGASLHIVAAGGGTATGESRSLFSTDWTAIGTSGYRYASTSGTTKVRVVVRRTAGGLATLKVVVRGDAPVLPPNGPVLPPNPGDEGGVILAAIGGDQYCVKLGGTAGGTEKVDSATRWKVVNATAEDGCPAVPVAVCGNNVREGSEECDGTDHSACLPMTCRFNCTCFTCGEVTCSPELGISCCDPQSVCVDTPGLGGFCFNGECDDPSQCGAFGTCQDGACCTLSGGNCQFFPGIELPCCSGDACVLVPGLGNSYCCLPAAAPCEAGSVPCCSGSCNAGTSTCD
jgi:hypothetical protein